VGREHFVVEVLQATDMMLKANLVAVAPAATKGAAADGTMQSQ
jgi:hypothetical protein